MQTAFVPEMDPADEVVRPQPQAPGNPPWALEVVRVVVLVISAFLLTSLGGAAAMAAPVTLPLLFWCAYSTSSPVTGAFVVLVGGLTAWETGWIITYVLDAKRSANEVGIGAGIAFAIILGLTTFRKRDLEGAG